MHDHLYRRNGMVEYVIERADNIHYHVVNWQYMGGWFKSKMVVKLEKISATYSIHTPQSYFAPQSNFTPLLHRKLHRKIL